MSEAEQSETSQRTVDEWNELEAELAEMRKKRDQLDAQNLRVTDNLRKAIEEREQAVDVAWALREQVTGMNVALQEMRSTRDMFWRQRDEFLRSRDASDKAAAAVQQDLVKITAERDHAIAACCCGATRCSQRTTSTANRTCPDNRLSQRRVFDREP